MDLTATTGIYMGVFDDRALRRVQPAELELG